MNVEVKRIGVAELVQICWAIKDLSADEIARISKFGGQSTVILVYWFGAELIAIVGFIPTAALTDTAYIWMQSTPNVARHKLMVCRLGILTLREIRKQYPKIIGHCMVGSRSIAWLKSLGARFGTPIDTIIPFIIENQNG